jgi:hypothetical protein
MSSYGQGSPGVFSLSLSCPVSNAVEGDHARASPSFCSSCSTLRLATFFPLPKRSHAQNNNNLALTHHTALTSYETLIPRSMPDSEVTLPMLKCLGAQAIYRWSSRFPKRDENVDHGSRFIRESEREKGSNQIISREFDGVKPNPRSFPSDPIRSRWFAIFSCGTELGICWTSDVRWKTSIQ